MKTHGILLVGLAVIASACASDTFDPPQGLDEFGVAGDGNLSEVLETVREGWEVPALGTVLIHDGAVLEVAAVGLRSLDSSEAVTVDDLWHVGSLTQSMTATAAASMVEEGLVEWTSTVVDVLPDIADDIRAEYRDLTLEELLAHVGGLPDREAETTWWEARPHPEPLREQRLAWTIELLNQDPGATRGEYLYSDAGYVVAGTMLERASGLTWEDLVQARVFQPLRMSSVGFGAPGTSLVDEPWGHSASGTALTPVAPGPDADYPPAIGPAGTVHLSLRDYATFASAHLAGELGSEGILSPESFQKLHTRVSTSTVSALGWNTLVRGWAHGIGLQHAGSNGNWFAVAWLAPQRNFAMLAVTNAGGERAGLAADAALEALLERFEAFDGS